MNTIEQIAEIWKSYDKPITDADIKRMKETIEQNNIMWYESGKAEAEKIINVLKSVGHKF